MPATVFGSKTLKAQASQPKLGATPEHFSAKKQPFGGKSAYIPQDATYIPAEYAVQHRQSETQQNMSGLLNMSK